MWVDLPWFTARLCLVFLFPLPYLLAKPYLLSLACSWAHSVSHSTQEHTSTNYCYYYVLIFLYLCYFFLVILNVWRLHSMFGLANRSDMITWYSTLPYARGSLVSLRMLQCGMGKVLSCTEPAWVKHDCKCGGVATCAKVHVPSKAVCSYMCRFYMWCQYLSGLLQSCLGFVLGSI